MARKLRKIKPVGQSPGHEKLRQMKCFRQVHERICQGWPITEVARWVQEDQEEYTHVTRNALVMALRSYRQAIPAAEKVGKRLPKDFAEAKQELEDTIDEVRELEELYRLQMDRIKIDYEKEQQISKLFPSMTSEIKEARALLESMIAAKQAVGVYSQTPQEHNLNVEVGVEIEGRLAEDLNTASQNVKAVMENPESRRKVTGVVDRFLRLSQLESKASSE